MTDLLLGLSVLFGMALWDFLCALYVLAVGKKQAVKSGLLAAGMYAVSALVIIEVVQANWLILPTCAGAFIGTFLGVRIVGTSTKLTKV